MAIQIAEKDFREQVLRLAATLGWRVFSVDQSTRMIRTRGGSYIRVRNINPSGVGFPDLVLCRGRRLVFAELKRDAGPKGGRSGVGRHAGETRPEQVEWLAALRETAAEVFTWRPSDIEAIALELSRSGL